MIMYNCFQARLCCSPKRIWICSTCLVLFACVIDAPRYYEFYLNDEYHFKDGKQTLFTLLRQRYNIKNISEGDFEFKKYVFSNYFCIFSLSSPFAFSYRYQLYFKLIFLTSIKTFIPIVLCTIFTVLLLNALREARKQQKNMITRPARQKQVKQLHYIICR